MASIITLLLQTPSATPNPGDKNTLDLSNPFELIMFVILPIAIVIFYILYRKQVRNKKE